MIHYTLERASLEDDLENTVTTIEGEILHDEEETEAGNIKATYIDILTASETGEPLPYVFDHVDEQLHNYHLALRDKKNPLHNYLLKNKDWFIEEAYDNLFFINYVLVNALYRGKKLGLAAIYRTIQKFAHGCRFTMLEAVPLQLITKEPLKRTTMGLNFLEQDKEKATNSLKAYYKKLGFEIVPRSNYMILDLELKHPNLKDIGFTASY